MILGKRRDKEAHIYFILFYFFVNLFRGKPLFFPHKNTGHKEDVKRQSNNRPIKKSGNMDAEKGKEKWKNVSNYYP